MCEAMALLNYLVSLTVDNAAIPYIVCVLYLIYIFRATARHLQPGKVLDACLVYICQEVGQVMTTCSTS